MLNSKNRAERKLGGRNLVIAVITAWTAVIAVSALWNLHLIRQGTVRLAHAEALSSLNKDLVYRRWAAGHGGVYVPISKETPPNPYLSGIAERDIFTPKGRALTLVNPAYMTRQVCELGSRLYGSHGHITSRQPLRSENAPDQWEAKALLAFVEKGVAEVSEVIRIDGKPYLRLMLPLNTEESCLLCHKKQGLKLNDLRGGISVSVPIGPYAAVARSNSYAISFGHGLIWLLGLTGIGFSASAGRKRIIKQLRAEEALKESEQRLADVIDFLPDATIAVDEEKKVIVWNRAMEELTGIPAGDMIGKGENAYAIPFYGERKSLLMDLIWDPDMQVDARYPYISWKGNSIISEVYCQSLYKGKGAYLLLKVSPLHDKDGRITGAIESIRDITDFKRTEEARLQLERQILQTQKLESLGVLAGGIAHDFNNILTAVLGYANLAMMKLPPASSAHGCIQQIEKAAHRAAELCRQMLDYSGKGRFISETIHLQHLIQEMVPLLKASISKKVELKLNLAEDTSPICGDASQIRQIVMNLVINASEAVGEEIGAITVSIGSMECSHLYLANMYLGEDLPDGRYVRIEVSDTGSGMDQETRSRIFEPFFTTKFTGRGLGLAAVLGIVRGHKGALQIHTQPGKGTTFKVIFPIAEDLSAPPGKKIVDGPDIWQGTGTVLLVDDDEAILLIGREMLELSGFHVLSAADGCEAVELYREHHRGIDLVILDLIMPCMDGKEAFLEMRRINPEVRVILSSGYTEDDIAVHFASKGLAGFMQKPYTLEALRDCLRIALE
jgi:signal transduction histidine kinase/CheY-like chemotaxis protein